MGTSGEAESRVRRLQVRVRPLPRPQRDHARAHHLLHRNEEPDQEGIRYKVQRKEHPGMVDTRIKVRNPEIMI